jgi:hypothetical protein
MYSVVLLTQVELLPEIVTVLLDAVLLLPIYPMPPVTSPPLSISKVFLAPLNPMEKLAALLQIDPEPVTTAALFEAEFP